MNTKLPSPEVVRLGQKIKTARKRLKLKMSDVRRLTGIDETRQSMFEQAKRTPLVAHLQSYANALGVTFRIAPTKSVQDRQP